MKQKGFTLIELLVVVAIIGILAAVGVVAYSGYTSSAKKNAVKSRHDMLVKLYKAEFEKCNVGEKVNLLNNTVDICPYDFLFYTLLTYPAKFELPLLIQDISIFLLYSLKDVKFHCH